MAEILAEFEGIGSDGVLRVLNRCETLILETINYDMRVPEDINEEFEKQPARLVNWLLAFLVYEPRVESKRGTSTLYSRPRPRGGSSPRNIHVAAAAPPRLVSAACPRRGRGRDLRTRRSPFPPQKIIEDLGRSPQVLRRLAQSAGRGIGAPP